MVSISNVWQKKIDEQQIIKKIGFRSNTNLQEIPISVFIAGKHNTKK